MMPQDILVKRVFQSSATVTVVCLRSATNNMRRESGTVNGESTVEGSRGVERVNNCVGIARPGGF